MALRQNQTMIQIQTDPVLSMSSKRF